MKVLTPTVLPQTGNDLIEDPYKMNARLSCHTNLVPTVLPNINIYLFMPDPFLLKYHNSLNIVKEDLISFDSFAPFDS